MLEIIGAGAILAVMILGVGVVVLPPSHSYEPPDPALWDGESLFPGEAVSFASFSIAAPGGRWAAGFLYLTKFRIVWIPGDFHSPTMGICRLYR